MTKLGEWVVAAVAVLAIWYALLTNNIENSLSKQHPQLLLFSPVIFLILFGLYALSVVLYRVATFNNCEKAAEELQMEIQEARKDLIKLGFKFKETQNS